MWMKLIMAWTISLFGAIAHASIYQVGASQMYVSPNALYQAGVLQDGDTVRIAGGDYYGQAALAHWVADNLLIQGVEGRPHLHADGEYILGKGIWVCGGDNITVENIEFSGAVVPDKNGAGIRLDGIGLTVRNCYFHNNETGILTNSPYDGHVLVEYTEFGYNGNGDGQSHNIYVNHADTLTFQYNHTHHSIIGHCIKSRADYNFILYNRIMDEEDGQSSRLIDVPNGGQCVIMGNAMMQGPTAENYNMIGYGLEGLVNQAPHKVYIVNNTMVSTRSNSLFFHVESGTELAYAANNVIAGSGTLVNGTLSLDSVNAIYEDITAIGFIDADNYDYRLAAGALPIDMGLDVTPLDGIDLTPLYHYVHPVAQESRVTSNQIDIGAYEYEASNYSIEIETESIVAFPNPVHNRIYFSRPLTSVWIVDITGKLVFGSEEMISDVDISQFRVGMYTVISAHRAIARFVVE